MFSDPKTSGIVPYTKAWNFTPHTWANVVATNGTDVTVTNGTVYVGSIYLPGNVPLTGIQYLIGSVGGTDKVIAALYDINGVLLANSATAGVTVGTSATVQQVAFTSPITGHGPGHFFIGLCFNGTTAHFRAVPAATNCNGVQGGSATQTFGTPANITPPSGFTADLVPVAGVY